MGELSIDSIEISGRHRQRLGDLQPLAESIRRVGLLHPVVVTEGGKLIAGQRRLEACRLLGWTEVPVNAVTDLDEARLALEAERDENTCRLDMAPSEKVALGLELEKLEKPRAEERERAGRPSGNLPEGTKGQTRDLVGAAVGMSGKTYERAKAVVAATDDPDHEVAFAAREAVEEMDSTGKVSGAYEQVTAAKRSAADFTSVRTVRTERQRQLAEAACGRVDHAMTYVETNSQWLSETDFTAALAGATPDTVRRWARIAKAASRQLKDVNKRLEAR